MSFIEDIMNRARQEIKTIVLPEATDIRTLKATDKILKRNVAVKILRDEFTTDEEFIKRFNIEAQAIACFTHPNIVSVYNDFHEKGLEIISVSLDTDKNAWIKGINDDGLYWDNHVSDLKGWNCAASTEYGVAFIPQNVLINDNGIIIAKNLNGDELRLFIEKYLE